MSSSAASNDHKVSDTSGFWCPEFSNCYEPAAAIVINSVTYRSTEHYYQSRKFRDATSQEHICLYERPIQAKFAARALCNKAQRKETLSAGATIQLIPIAEWDARKEAIMFEATFAKYRQHKLLRQLLLMTGDQLIIKPNTHDEYWGCGKDGKSGLNRLGHVLMEVRRVLRKEEEQKLLKVCQ